MRSTPSLATLCVLLPVLSHAQALQGTVRDQNGQPIAAALVSLRNAPDSALVRSELSDSLGHYAFRDLANGAYRLEVSAAGYRSKQEEVLLGGQPIRKDLSLETTDHQLKEVTVGSTRPFIEAKPGMMVVNVENSPASAGNNALELLQQSPGVQVDEQGNVSLKGRPGIQILIDGKPSNLSGEQLAAYLKGMSSEEIAQIELMTQPPSKYEAAGNAGLINIRTRKLRRKGFSGHAQAAYTQGTYPGGNSSLQLNMKHNRFTAFASHYYVHNERYYFLRNDRNFREGSGAEVTSNFLTNSNNHYVGNFHRFRAGIEYTPTDRTQVSAGLRLPVGSNSSETHALTEIRDFTQSSLRYNKVLTNNRNNWHEKQADLLLRHTFKNKSELSGDAFYVTNEVNSLQYQHDLHTASGSEILYRNESPDKVSLATLQADYSSALNSKLKLEAGLKYHRFYADNQTQASRMENGSFVRDTGRSSHLLYREDIHAAYATLSAILPSSVELQAGLRAEQTLASGRLPQTGQSFERHYVSLFPSFSASYKPNEAHQLSFSYSRRVDRPSYDQMNPARYYTDRYTYTTGNPYLRPQFSNNLELTHSLQGKLSTTLSYAHVSDVINDVFIQDDNSKVTYQDNRNIATYQQWGASVAYNNNLKKWWTISLYGDWYYKQYQGRYDTLDFTISGSGYSVNASSQFKLPAGWSAEIGGWYSSPTPGTVFTLNDAMGAVRAGIAKRFLKDTLTVKLNVQDVFAQLSYQGSNRFANFDYDVYARWDEARRCTVSLSYNFGKQIELMQRKNESAELGRPN